MQPNAPCSRPQNSQRHAAAGQQGTMALCLEARGQHTQRTWIALQRVAAYADGYSAADLEALLDRTVHAAATRSLAGQTAITPGAHLLVAALHAAKLGVVHVTKAAATYSLHKPEHCRQP